MEKHTLVAKENVGQMGFHYQGLLWAYILKQKTKMGRNGVT